MKETPIHQYLKDITNEDETIHNLLKKYEINRQNIEVMNGKLEKGLNDYSTPEERAENWREIVEKMIYGIFPEDDIRECDDVAIDFCKFLDISYGIDWFIPR